MGVLNKAKTHWIEWNSPRRRRLHDQRVFSCPLSSRFSFFFFSSSLFRFNLTGFYTPTKNRRESITGIESEFLRREWLAAQKNRWRWRCFSNPPWLNFWSPSKQRGIVRISNITDSWLRTFDNQFWDWTSNSLASWSLRRSFSLSLSLSLYLSLSFPLLAPFYFFFFSFYDLIKPFDSQDRDDDAFTTTRTLGERDRALYIGIALSSSPPPLSQRCARFRN